MVSFLIVLIGITQLARCEIGPDTLVLWLDFADGTKDMRLVNGVKRIEGRFGGALELNTALHYAEIPAPAGLDGSRR